jgi:hypothetical protein
MKLFVLALCALGLFASASGPAQSKPTTYGKNLVKSYELPAEDIARFVRFDAARAGKAPSVPALNTEDWHGEAIPAPSSGNPYVQVVRVSGTALADGEAGTSWMGGWAVEGTTRGGLITGASSASVKAGERVSLVGVSSPLSFKEDLSRAPALGFMGSRNIRIDGVQMEVWSGIGKPTFVQLIFSWSPLLVGLVFLGLFFWFRRS